MRIQLLRIMSVLGVCLLAGPSVFAQADPGALNRMMKSLNAPLATEHPLMGYSEDGYVRYVGAPPGGAFSAPGVTKATTPAAAAAAFIEAHGAAFGLRSPRASMVQERTQQLNGHHYVRLDQTYSDLPIFGAEMVATIDASREVTGLLSDILRDTSLLDDGSLSLTPRITPMAAALAGREKVAELNEGVSLDQLELSTGPDLVIFAPSVLSLDGPIRLAYEMNVRSTTVPPVYDKVLVDAHAGEAVLRYPLTHNALGRQIYDANGSFNFSLLPTREETDGATGITEVDDAYDQLGDVYNFYFDRFRWDSYNNAGGMLRAVVRLPYYNAGWYPNNPGSIYSNIMIFGTGFVVDDVTAHEVSHGVTEYTSNLIYLGLSGAINESMSDIFGEFIDLTNGSGNDAESVRWRIAEDLPEEILRIFEPSSTELGFRDMRDPTIFGSPDKVSSPYFIDPSATYYDNGGVHYNSGIPNKLCYLLTDGEEFNGQEVEGMGMDRVARLFFGAQMILPPGANFEDLYFALSQVSVALGFSLEERLNLLAAAKAVEIDPDRVFDLPLNAGMRATPVLTTGGEAAIALLWENAPEHPTNAVLVQRSTSGYPKTPTEGERIVESDIQAYLDTDVVEGTQYYYTAFIGFAEGPVIQANATAVAGEIPPDYLAEAFGNVDLSFKQITYLPVGAPEAPLDSELITGFEKYTAMITPIQQLPVGRNDGGTGAATLDLSEDGFVLMRSNGPAFPFFGKQYSELVLAANGYVFFESSAASLREDELFAPFNFPSLASHFASPRISFLFTDLGAGIGGEIWVKSMDDRIVITVEEMPEFQALTSSFPPTNTAQLELFYSGMIRMSWLEMAAEEAVIGLSDGLGVPIDPAEYFDNILSTGGFLVDLSALPASAQRLSLAPLESPFAAAGDTIEFMASAIAPAGVAGVPRLRAEWDRPELVPFVDNLDGSGSFRWESSVNDDGYTHVRVIADLAGETAFQDVRIVLGENTLPPVATNLRLVTETAGEDPSVDRTVPTETALFAEYTYTHPQLSENPFTLREGDTRVVWYKNSRVVPGLLNMMEVPSSLTRSNDSWYFSVTPVTRTGIVGETVASPVVTIGGGPVLDLVAPNFALVVGGDVVRLKGRRLTGPLRVTFGGIPAQNFRSLGDSEIEVTTPLHNGGTVYVEVQTINGTVILPNAFSFLTDLSQAVGTDVNGDGRVDAVDIQMVVNAVLEKLESKMIADVNGDGAVNAADIQAVVNDALKR